MHQSVADGGDGAGTLSSGRNLSGTGVIVAVIDSGIDYTHPDFRNADGTTRILNLWDQTIPADSVADPFPRGEWRNVIFRGTVRVLSWN